MNRFDFSRIDVEQMLTSAGIDVVGTTGDEVSFRCPFPGHVANDFHPSTSMQKRTTAFFCFGCGRSGNAVTFVSMLEGISPMAAAAWLREQYGSDFREPQGRLWDELRRILSRPVAGPQEPPQELPAEALELFQIDWEAVKLKAEPSHSLRRIADRFEAATLGSFEVGYDSLTARFVIPARDADGRLVGFKGRASFDSQKPKYVVLGPRSHGFKPYEVGSIVFGLDRMQSDCAVICEGELDAMAVWEAGIDGGVAVGGSHFTERQLSLIRDRARRAVVFFDPDDAGEVAAARVAKQLEPFVRVRVVEGHRADPSDLTADERHYAVQRAISPLRSRLVRMTTT